MARYVDIDNEEFWDILFEEACVEGSQLDRIEERLKSLVLSESEICDKTLGKSVRNVGHA